jgi:phosphoenolpyruvate synthase/pyruvate phosphate dikinase
LPREKAPPPPGVAFSSKELQAPHRIGAKAYNLGVVRSLGFAVPEYVVVRYEGLKRLLDRPAPSQRLVAWALAQLNLPSDAKLALRSSALDEDRDTGSHAGQYRSLLNVGPDQIGAALGEFVRSNQRSNQGARYRGSIIIQRMIEAEYAGVCLTVDHRTGSGNTVIIELVKGGNQAVTQGTVLPDRVVVDRLTGDVREDQRRHPSPGIDIPDLVQQFLTLEAHFGTPLDIEWAWNDRKLSILQARPIVGERRAQAR